MCLGVEMQGHGYGTRPWDQEERQVEDLPNLTNSNVCQLTVLRCSKRRDGVMTGSPIKLSVSE